MFEWSQPDRETAIEIESVVLGLSEDRLIQDGYRFQALYGNEIGYYGDRPDNKAEWLEDEAGIWHRYVRRMRPRQWIERFIWIRDKGGNLIPLILNQPQRKLMAKIYRMIRAGVPVRIIILKARQMGFSTLVQAFCFQVIVRNTYHRALLIAHRAPTAKLILRMAHRMRQNIKSGDGERWEFKTPAKSTEAIAFGEPIDSDISVDSAEVDEPGHGDTVQVMHFTETSRWKQAEVKAKGLLQTLPRMAGTFGFNESTAAGDHGWFRDEFWRAWDSKDIPWDDPKRVTGWEALFFAWFESEEYRWSAVHGKELPEDIAVEIENTLTAEEEWLLRQSYLRRGHGLVVVDLDQLAWRRECIADQCQNSLGTFDEQYPSRPEVAFSATGNPIFEPEGIKERMRELRAPIWIGDLVVDLNAARGGREFEFLTPERRR